MKKINYLLVAILAVVTSCQKDIADLTKDQGLSSAVLYARDAATKTSVGNDWSVAWSAGDDLTVFNAEAGTTTYSDGCRFILDGTPLAGKFIKDAEQTSNALIDGAPTFDWYVTYPWMENGSAPGSTSAGYIIAGVQSQIGYDSSAHLGASDLMAGSSMNVAASETPSVALYHMCSILKFTITNNTGEATTITDLTLDATANGVSYITGSYSIDWSGAKPALDLDPTSMGSSREYTCTASIVKADGTAIDETVAAGESVDVYMAVAPFTIPAGKKISLTIKGSAGSCILEKTFAGGITFEAGKYNTASLSYTKPGYVVAGTSLVEKNDFFHATISLTKGQEVVCTGFDDLSKCYNRDFFSYEPSTQKLTFLRESGDWTIYYYPAWNYMWVTNDALSSPDCLYVLGQGFMATPNIDLTSNPWVTTDYQRYAPFYGVAPKIADNTYQVTLFICTYCSQWRSMLEFYSDLEWGQSGTGSITLDNQTTASFSAENGRIYSAWNGDFVDGYYRFTIVRTANGITVTINTAE